MVDIDDEDLWAPFLASRTPDRPAARLRTHAGEDQRRGQRHVPRRAAALSRDEIVRVAIEVADAEGADAVTMRRIARELNAGTMSLYWHIACKEELLDLMIDEIQGGRQLPELTGDWRQDMHALAINTRLSLHQHLWTMDFIGGRLLTGPKSLRNLERVLASFDGLGLNSAAAVDIVTTVGTDVLGAVLREVQERNRIVPRPAVRWAYRGRDTTGPRRVHRTGQGVLRYPRLLAMLDDRHDPDAAETRDARFEFGLSACSTASLLTSPSGPPPRHPTTATPGLISPISPMSPGQHRTRPADSLAHIVIMTLLSPPRNAADLTVWTFPMRWP